MRVIGTLATGGDTEAPSVPQNVNATALNKNEISASWDASTDNVGVSGYHVFANGVPQPDVTDGTSTTVTGLTPSTLYSITVAAFDAAGNNSGESAPDSATTPANAVPAWGSIIQQNVVINESYTLDLSAYVTDADTQDTHTYSVLSGTLPTGLALNGSIVSGTPITSGQSSTVTFRVSDGDDTADKAVAYVSVSNPEPLLSMANAQLSEGDSGSANMTFALVRAADVYRAISFSYETIDVTATAGSDYTAVSSSGQITSGQTFNINVPILGDAVVESDETFTVRIFNIAFV